MLKKYLIVFFISMVPLIELRGAIPYAIGYNLPILPSYIIAIIGNMLPNVNRKYVTFVIICLKYKKERIFCENLLWDFKRFKGR